VQSCCGCGEGPSGKVDSVVAGVVTSGAADGADARVGRSGDREGLSARRHDVRPAARKPCETLSSFAVPLFPLWYVFLSTAGERDAHKQFPPKAWVATDDCSE
jgi:hypothetical protein